MSSAKPRAFLDIAYEEAAQAYRTAALPLGEHYIEYADALTELRLLPEAANASRRAVEEYSAAGIPLMAAEAQLRVARLALLAGDCTAAAAAAETAAAEFHRQGRAMWRARAFIVTAEARLSCGTVTRADLAGARFPADRVDYDQAGACKQRLLLRAWQNFRAGAAAHLRQPLEPRKSAHVRQAVQFLADYPEEHAGNVVGLAWTPDSRHVLTSGRGDRTCKLWDAATGKLARTFPGFTEDVEAVAFSADGKSFLAGETKVVHVVDVGSGKIIHRFEDHTAGVLAVAFLPDGTRALSGGKDNVVRLWRVPK